MPYIDARYAAALLEESQSKKLSSCASFGLAPIWEERTEGEQAAFEKVKRLACVRERGSRELTDRLVRDGFSREDAQSAVQRGIDCGLIDDLRYGAVLVRTRVSQGRGRSGIEAELERAGISASDIPGWPEEFFLTGFCERLVDNGFGASDGEPVGEVDGSNFQELEIARALTLLRNKPPKAKNIQAAAYRKLISKGYSSSVCSAAVRRFVEEN